MTFTNLPTGKKVSEVCLTSLLKPVGKKKSKPSSSAVSGSGVAGGRKGEPNKVKRQLLQQQRDNLKKKQLKKQQRLKGLEEEREKEKHKWQQFNYKANNKHLKGAVKKSIFASPESVSGRVGVGTCGLGGKPMTEFTQADKYKRGITGSSLTGAATHSRHAHRYK